MSDPSNQQLSLEQGVLVPLAVTEPGDEYPWIPCVQKCTVYSTNCQLTIMNQRYHKSIGETPEKCTFATPIDDLDKSILHTREFQRVIFGNPRSSELFRFQNRNKGILTARIIQTLEQLNRSFIEHIAFPLDLSYESAADIFRYISSFPALREIELLRPTTFNLCPGTPETNSMQKILSASIGHFKHLSVFIIPLELVTRSLLSHLGKLPNLKIWIVKWNPHEPVSFPARKFLQHFQNFDTEGYFQALDFLDVGVRDLDDGFSDFLLRKLFPRATIL